MAQDPISLTPRCPIRTTLELLGGKWKMLILSQLAAGPMRMSALKKSIPDISEKMLIQELKTLAESNLVDRKNYGTVPPKVEYSITELGQRSLPLIESIKDFGLAYQQEIFNS